MIETRLSDFDFLKTCTQSRTCSPTSNIASFYCRNIPKWLIALKSYRWSSHMKSCLSTDARRLKQWNSCVILTKYFETNWKLFSMLYKCPSVNIVSNTINKNQPKFNLSKLLFGFRFEAWVSQNTQNNLSDELRPIWIELARRRPENNMSLSPLKWTRIILLMKIRSKIHQN